MAKELQFAPSTFGQKKEKEPTSKETMSAIAKLHKQMSDELKGPPGKTDFIVRCVEEDFTHQQIADTLGMKKSTVYSMWWSKTQKKSKRQRAAEAAAATGE
jgi:DNA-directed RNA polymerase specialized sigma24 family protein